MTAEGSHRASLLSHLTVLDLTQFLAGPFLTQILGDLGARVIKIEGPSGDLTRSLPPHFIDGDSAYYHSVNRNKESLCLDLKSPSAREIIDRLVARSDAVVENFRPGVVDRLGLGWDRLRTINDALVMCSISGFGQTGPMRDLPAYDAIVQALSGGMSITGEPKGEPVRMGIPVGDLGAGLYAGMGLLAALIDARRTGSGRYIEVSMLDCQVAMLSYQAAYSLRSGVAPGRQGSGHDSIPTYASFSCRDGRVVVTANTEGMWAGLCRALDLDELAEEDRFRTNTERFANADELTAVLDTAFSAFTVAEVVERLRDEGVPCAPILDVVQALNQEQVQERGMVQDLSRSGDHFQVSGNPIKTVAGGPARHEESRHAAAPRLGHDSRRLLAELGMDDAEIDALISMDVVIVEER